MVVKHGRAVSGKDFMKPFRHVSVLASLSEEQAGNNSIGQAYSGGHRGYIASLPWQGRNTLGIHAFRVGPAEPAHHVETMARGGQDQPSATRRIPNPNSVWHSFHGELTMNGNRSLDELLHLQDCRREPELEIHRERNTGSLGCCRDLLAFLDG